MFKIFKIHALALLIMLSITNQTHANSPIVIEIFTHASCEPVTSDTVNPDGTYKNPTAADKKFNKKEVSSTLKDILDKSPQIIGLHYHSEAGAHRHDENGNDLPSVENNEDLTNFISERNVRYYELKDFMGVRSSGQMIIHGTHKTEGTKKEIVDAAINFIRSEQKTAPIKLAINGQNLEMNLPKVILDQEININIIGYNKQTPADNFIVQPALHPKNIVSDYKTLSPWNGGSRAQTITISDMEADGFAVIAQNTKTGRIYAAGKVEK